MSAIDPILGMVKISSEIFLYQAAKRTIPKVVISPPPGQAPESSDQNTKRSPEQSSHPPDQKAKHAGEQPPEAVLLFTWMDAQHRHIAKYVDQYRARFPHTDIVLFKTPFTHYLWPFGHHQKSGLAAQTVRDVLAARQTPSVDTSPPLSSSSSSPSSSSSLLSPSSSSSPWHQADPKILIHVFSNGGLFSYYRTMNALTSQNSTSSTKHSTPSTSPLPTTSTLPPPSATTSPSSTTSPIWPFRHVAIFDSCPGRYAYQITYTAVRQSCTGRVLGPIIATLTVLSSVISSWFSVGEPWSNYQARASLSPAFQRREVRRVHIFGPRDQLIPASDVVRHIAEARLARKALWDQGDLYLDRDRGTDDKEDLHADKEGVLPDNGGASRGAKKTSALDALDDFDVRAEVFLESAHVSHMRSDPDRYWKIVEDAWYGQARSKL